MSEKLLENLIKIHENRPHFVLELFEAASKINSDEKRSYALECLKNLAEYQPRNLRTQERMEEQQKALDNIIKSGTDETEVKGILKKSTSPIPTLAEIAQKSINSTESSSSNTQLPPSETTDPLVKTTLPFLDQLNPNLNSDNDSVTTSSSDTEGGDGATTSNAEYSDIHTNEREDLKRIDESKTDMVTKMLGAAQLGVNIEQAQDEVKTLVTELLPTLSINYRNKILTNEVIAEAKKEIAEHILKNSEAFNADQNKVYLYTTIENCLKAYKDKSVGEESTNILMDIGTSILKAMLHAKAQK